jgi:hypothetical protein
MTQDNAIAILKTGANVFLTGEPGSGKTYTLNRYLEYLYRHGVDVAVTASTGIAATHVGGVTIHSWSGIGINNNISEYDLDRISSNEHVARRVGEAQVLVIDEISMLSAETLDSIDMVCRAVRRNENAFGGMQVVFVGDFFQLPPVSAPGSQPQFAFESRAWTAAQPLVCYLSEQHRQSDPKFLGILAAIRANSFDQDQMENLSGRIIGRDDLGDSLPRLFSHNVNVDSMNTARLGNLPGMEKTYRMTALGNKTLVESLKRGCLSPEVLILKSGARVMFTKNNPGKGFYNGTLGVVEKFRSEDGMPVVKTRGGQTIVAEPMDWTVEEHGQIRARIKQLPLRLAWAITVHKSQGMSLDAAVMDLSQVFEYGQGYVALSRVRNLGGLHILGLNGRAFEVHPRILAEDKKFHDLSLSAEQSFGNAAESELDQLHRNFILSVGGTLQEQEQIRTEPKPKPKRKKGSTIEETLKLWNAGCTLKEISDARKLVFGTILSHIESLVVEERIAKEDLRRILPPDLARDLPHIHNTFRMLKTDKLGLVFERLNKAYSYDELRLARMLLD